MNITIKEISGIIGGTFFGDPLKEIIGINSLDKATKNQISYATSKKHIKSLINLTLRISADDGVSVWMFYSCMVLLWVYRDSKLYNTSSYSFSV